MFFRRAIALVVLAFLLTACSKKPEVKVATPADIPNVPVDVGQPGKAGAAPGPGQGPGKTVKPVN